MIEVHDLPDRVIIELNESLTPPGLALELHVYRDAEVRVGIWFTERGLPLTGAVKGDA